MRIFFLILFSLSITAAWAQPSNGGRLSGSLQTNANFFIRDTAIGAANTPQYDRQLFGSESWLELNYSNWGFDMGLRFDLFLNSNLLNPQGSYTDQGIGRWFIKKQVEKFRIEAGYLYDQIGSGIIFRAYEQRPIAIDNALAGISVSYELKEDWTLKAFAGRQKQQFDLYDSNIKGFNVEGFLAGGEKTPWSIAPGIGMVNKTLADETVNQIVSAISTYTPQDSIGANYNTFAFSAYNTLTLGPITWYVEGAYKSSEVIFDPFAEKLNWTGDRSLGKLVQRPGSVLYSTLSYAANGLGITLEGKRTENFTFRTNPFVTLNQGAINFLPPMARENSFRLLTRYNAATQELGEQAWQLDLRYAPNRKWGVLVNLASIQQLDGTQLYQELFSEFSYRYQRKWHLLAGVQLQRYNQAIYEVKPGVPDVRTVSPYVEWTYKLDRKKSLRFELQYMHNEQDFGSWIFVLAEFGMAPNWVFSVSDMYNVVPTKTPRIHYPRLDISYTRRANRFIASYVKQVEGVVCTGGICRFEPAFSGFRLSINSTF
ncbi:MAG: DUF6029 family protein [Bacteroidota bacterium]